MHCLVAVNERSPSGLCNVSCLLRQHAPGREDMDVRMLGKGRPFALEVQNARKCTHSEPFFREVEAQLQQVGSCAATPRPEQQYHDSCGASASGLSLGLADPSAADSQAQLGKSRVHQW